MNISGRIKSLGAAAALAAAMVSSPFAAAGEIIIGNDVTDRASTDTWRNFVISLDTEVFPLDNAFVLDWSVWAETTGDLALLIMDGDTVVASDSRTITHTGLNTFDFVATSGSAAVNMGYNVGLWMGSALVSFDYGATNADGSLDTVRWCSSDGCAQEAPGAGDSFALTSWAPWDQRQYSVSVTDPVREQVPAPGSLALMGLGLLGLGARLRRR
jgi:hypothetical protein